ncbi:hypothetical protein Zm00014a_005469 [Zea mays]|uniref:Uncharacterized protein n=1 Tax=Zea mays TaxID=4577 RepID=A0A3L6FZA8_MAIZE|nr:hypothetical protein Zm00014a_005469 [Zea mays]
MALEGSRAPSSHGARALLPSSCSTLSAPLRSTAQHPSIPRISCSPQPWTIAQSTAPVFLPALSLPNSAPLQQASSSKSPWRPSSLYCPWRQAAAPSQSMAASPCSSSPSRARRPCHGGCSALELHSPCLRAAAQCAVDACYVLDEMRNKPRVVDSSQQHRSSPCVVVELRCCFSPMTSILAAALARSALHSAAPSLSLPKRRLKFLQQASPSNALWQHGASPHVLGARRIAAAGHALRLRFGLPCATTRSYSRHMCNNHDRGLIW